ncbi:MAG: hypothetical protein KC503_00255 [Myxococcales bacterium]|nr:hypothetical protein [Myxococcales bacterium]
MDAPYRVDAADGPIAPDGGDGPAGDGPMGDSAPPAPKTLRLTAVGGDGHDYVGCFAANASGVAVLASSATSARTVAGTTITPAGTSDAYVVRLDASGAVSWVVQVGGAGVERIGACAVDAAGNVYLGGQHDSGLSVGGQSATSQGFLDGFALKLNATDGSVAWLKALGEAKSDRVGGLALDSSGDVIVSGVMRIGIVVDGVTISATGGNNYVLRLDAASGARKAHGTFGKGLVEPLHVSTGASGAIAVGGFFGGVATFGTKSYTAAGIYDLYVAKLDTSLQLSWHAVGTGDGTHNAITTAITSSGRVVACGGYTMKLGWGSKSLTQGTPLREAFIVGFDSSGAASWLTKVPGGGNSYNTCDALAPTASGDRVITGGSFTGGLTAFGSTQLDEGDGPYLAAVDAQTGNYLWAFNNRSGSTASNSINGVALTTSGNAIVGGSFASTLMVGTKRVTATAAEETQMYLLETELP